MLHEMKYSPRQPPRIFPKPPDAPEPPPAPTPWTRPSLGCTSTQPSPLNAICNVSPDPRPIRVLRLASTFTWVWTPADQVIAAWASANVGALATSRSTGGPSERTATQPVPLSAML